MMHPLAKILADLSKNQEKAIKAAALLGPWEGNYEKIRTAISELKLSNNPWHNLALKLQAAHSEWIDLVGEAMDLCNAEDAKRLRG